MQIAASLNKNKKTTGPSLAGLLGGGFIRTGTEKFVETAAVFPGFSLQSPKARVARNV